MESQPAVATPYNGKSTDSHPSSHGCFTQMRNPLAGCSLSSWPPPLHRGSRRARRTLTHARCASSSMQRPTCWSKQRGMRIAM